MSTPPLEDPRRAQRASVRWAKDGAPRGLLFVRGRLWGAIAWSPRHQAWSIEDALGRCLRPVVSSSGPSKASRSEALALARAMIRAGQFPTPQQAQAQRQARRAAHAERRARKTSPGPIPLHSSPSEATEALELGRQGGDRRSAAFREQGDNVTLKERGNARAYLLARLRRDGFLELAAKVDAKLLSARAAAIQAGFRNKPDTVEIRRKAPVS